MEIKVTQENGRVPVTVFHLDGELASESYQMLETQAKEAIAGGTCYLLLDMTKVPFMGSAGIRAINQIFNWLRSLPDGEDEAALKTTLRDGQYKSRRLKLLNPGQQVLRTMATAGIDTFLEVYHDQKQAITSF